jgi:hypothetical protein
MTTHHYEEVGVFSQIPDRLSIVDDSPSGSPRREHGYDRLNLNMPYGGQVHQRYNNLDPKQGPNYIAHATPCPVTYMQEACIIEMDGVTD